MNAVEIYEKASWDLEHNKITLGEFEERIKALYDVEPVRRCDKCKKWEPFEGEESGYGICTFWSDFIKKQENINVETFNECFCCWGKKREQEELAELTINDYTTPLEPVKPRKPVKAEVVTLEEQDHEYID